MLILDSNVWILSLIESDSEHAKRREQIEDSEERSAVSAYIYNEVVANLQRVPDVDREEIDGLIEDFTTVLQSPHIEAPTQTEIEQLALDAVRDHPAYVALGRVLHIQPKDAPIVALAVKYAVEIEATDSDERVTIVTSDRSFGDLDPNEYDLGIEMEYLSYP